MSKKSCNQGEISENYCSPGSSCLHLLTRGACNHQKPSVKICKIRMKSAWSWNMFRHVGFDIFNLSIALFTSKGLNDLIVKEENPGQPEQQSGEPTLLFLILFNTSKKENRLQCWIRKRPRSMKIIILTWNLLVLCFISDWGPLKLFG